MSTTAAVAGTLSTFLVRLADFAEPSPHDDVLDVCCGPSLMTHALDGRVGRITAAAIGAGDSGQSGQVHADPTALPFADGSFSLVTARFALHRLADPAAALAEMLRVCHPSGRIVVADLSRTNLSSDHRDALERVRDPGFRSIPRIDDLIGMVEGAGARITGMDLLSVERPAAPWLEAAPDPRIAERLREVLLAEVDGGPKTGASPRVIGGELWFTQTWAHLAARPR
ncbi:class I SAM-dependent methyltransferase [Actinocorallia sp. A-T 12471]|uniref:class I SAM-dependent methyltransferase n=1 Tax=Actinocorallia sp. A-T 12471 TaxID=3089813 RepID=UPI0029CCBAC9|nr:methyltransferase domain-containing protein [Actinocorallia sp. A-T 12471]MDX6738396.1 methyltransferase domain-containing protein [Actinocorallia sp. A-T 12471]